MMEEIEVIFRVYCDMCNDFCYEYEKDMYEIDFNSLQQDNPEDVEIIDGEHIINVCSRCDNCEG